ncbi:MAG: hypothetical protein J7639_20510 [Paenibacillaceae bacterium]|nr:hypothetical protein [Paenibacillaceae bacterium]
MLSKRLPCNQKPAKSGFYVKVVTDRTHKSGSRSQQQLLAVPTEDFCQAERGGASQIPCYRNKQKKWLIRPFFLAPTKIKVKTLAIVAQTPPYRPFQPNSQ